ncbi:MAG: HAD hydrolase-like protein [Patescibacteria group bacterium]|nr:HAD hydrolase-like protein [Patescibacteria group bacterium]
MKIVFDFDHTLLSTKKFYFSIRKRFRKSGVSEKEFFRTYEDSRDRDGNYEPWRQVDLLVKRNKQIQKQKLIEELEESLKKCSNFLYSDVRLFLKKIKDDNELFILTYGVGRLQEEKINHTKIQPFFKKIFVSPNIDKSITLQKIIKKNEKAIFIDDYPETLFKAKKKFKNLITVRINRGEGKYSILLDNSEIDFSIKNLGQLECIINEIKKSKHKALLLFSGGLDSILALKILENQGIKTTLLFLKTYFFDEKIAKKMAENLKKPLMVVDISKKHLEMVKKPKYGYGKAMNPCIDCHILMLEKAKEIFKKEKFDFIATGDVLGERPMSQNRKTLDLIEKQSSLKGVLLRPLSAKLLNETIPEKNGLVDRKKLLDISGRSRKKQIELAKKSGIKQYPSPAGGCLLTDIEFAKKVSKLFKICPKCSGNDVELLKLGRHFFFNKIKIVIGRNEKEDKKMRKIAQKKDVLIEMKNYSGPLTLIRNYSKNKLSMDILEKAKKMTKNYSKFKNKKNIEFKFLNESTKIPRRKSGKNS